ncbi:MAG: hypothetical protein KBT12_05390 [Bacteroidales bacterium]|nr:hypothetical protein [Candidatus Physcousia equi]
MLLLWLFSAVAGAQKVSILGDSYSTFAGHVAPAWNAVWYKGVESDPNYARNDVHEVGQTWWSLLIAQKGYTLERNNSFSGSTVSYSGYRKETYTDRSFVTRMCDLGNPDIIFVLSGTNDSWANAPIGKYQYKKWKRADLFNFRPAFCYMMDYLTTNYPHARIVNICNSELSPEVTESQAVICKHYKVTHVLLKDIEKQAGHPSQKGMKAIAEQVAAAL